ncbi:MAG: glycerol-3-phosphate dehydrogenase [Leptospiraceae bacterium]|nr:MAG: glycerol-3-phosphate dehydrogenase [Leptospiraceae bacterium]
MFALEIQTEIKDSQEFDILIIGGGITGIAIAREAAERGHSVGLIEKNDFGWATSAATSKLIHGGLRYLENFDFGLVRESLKERRILMLAACHLVKPLPFIIPILPWTEPNPLLIYTGLKLYDMLSYDRNQFVPEESYIPSSRKISHHELINVLPELKKITQKGGFLYYDCQSLHPERLTLTFLKSAAEKGAKFYNHTIIENFITERKGEEITLKGVEVKDEITGKSATFKAKIIINATGPWIDILLSKITGKPVKKILRSKGIHLLTKQILNHKVAVLFRTKTHRHFFVIPWMGYSLIGPTDTPYTDDPDKLRPTEEDVQQLLTDVNETLSENILTEDMIIDIPIGIRPLIFTGKGNTYKASRKYEIFHHNREGIHNLISVAGGKWTTSRQLGEDVINEIYKEYPELEKQSRRIDTSQLPLYGSPGYSNPYSIYENFALKEFHIDEISVDQHKYLIELYGTEHIEILKIIKDNPSLSNPVSELHPEKDVLAQVVFAIQYEGARTLDDVVRRRIGYGTYGIPDKKDLEKIAKLMAKYLKWNSNKIQEEIEKTISYYPVELLKS